MLGIASNCLLFLHLLTNVSFLFWRTIFLSYSSYLHEVATVYALWHFKYCIILLKSTTYYGLVLVRLKGAKRSEQIRASGATPLGLRNERRNLKWACNEVLKEWAWLSLAAVYGDYSIIILYPQCPQTSDVLVKEPLRAYARNQERSCLA